jgi:hypothetical protein
MFSVIITIMDRKLKLFVSLHRFWFNDLSNQMCKLISLSEAFLGMSYHALAATHKMFSLTKGLMSRK